MNLPDPHQIIKDEVQYGLEDFFNEFKQHWYSIEFKQDITDKEKEEGFKSLFMMIMLSAEEKPMSVMTDVFKMPEERIKEFQEAFSQEIDVVRHIHMKKYLDLYGEYYGGMDMTIRLLNIWIHNFLKKHIREEQDGNT